MELLELPHATHVAGHSGFIKTLENIQDFIADINEVLEMVL